MHARVPDGIRWGRSILLPAKERISIYAGGLLLSYAAGFVLTYFFGVPKEAEQPAETLEELEMQ